MTAKRNRGSGARPGDDSVALARTCALLADEKKGEEIVILDLRKLTYITDFFVIVTVANPRQMNAVNRAIEQELAKRGEKPIGSEGTQSGRWVLLDYGDVVVHLFDREWRRLYDLELLWGDAPRLEWDRGN